MTTSTTNNHVTRAEFDATIRRFETILDKQTAILQTLAVAEVENRVRDQKILENAQAVVEIQKEQKLHSQKLAWYAGAIAAASAIWPFVSKKLGLS